MSPRLGREDSSLFWGGWWLVLRETQPRVKEDFPAAGSSLTNVALPRRAAGMLLGCKVVPGLASVVALDLRPGWNRQVFSSVTLGL